MDRRVQFMKIANRANQDMAIDFEPSAWHWVLRPGEVMRIGALCPEDQSLHISFEDSNLLVVWYEESVVWVQEDDGRINIYGNAHLVREDELPRFPD